jgi:hypothetical protein
MTALIERMMAFSLLSDQACVLGVAAVGLQLIIFLPLFSLLILDFILSVLKIKHVLLVYI